MGRICLLLILLLGSCTQRKLREDNVTVNEDTTVVSGSQFLPGASVFLSRLACKQNGNLHYSVYYPASYDTFSSFPVLMLFDPHADSELPLRMYSHLADKYRFILMSSCNSKNGNDAALTAEIIQTMLAQVRYLSKADTSAILCGGFSGGARVAAMAGLSPSGIKALILCGAGIPAGAWTGLPPHLVLAIAGNRDMNLYEVIRYKTPDPRLLSRYQVIRFNGEHAWPPSQQMEYAFIACRSILHRDGLLASEKSLLENAYKEMSTQVALEKNPVFKAELLKSILKNFQGLLDMKNESGEYENLTRSVSYRKAISEEEKLFMEEERGKAYYMQAIGTKDTNWWKTQMHSMLDTLSLAAVPLKIDMTKRVQGAISLTLYMSLMRAISALALDQQLYLSALYRYADPGNPEAWYLSSVSAANAGNAADAKKFLGIAFEKGFNDPARCRKEPAFSSLLSDYSFQSIIP